MFEKKKALCTVTAVLIIGKGTVIACNTTGALCMVRISADTVNVNEKASATEEANKGAGRVTVGMPTNGVDKKVIHVAFKQATLAVTVRQVH